MSKRVLAILNPISGRRDMTPVVRAVEALLREAGGSLHVEPTRPSGETSARVAELAPDFDAVLVVGGDGTVCEVVNGLAGRPGGDARTTEVRPGGDARATEVRPGVDARTTGGHSTGEAGATTGEPLPMVILATGTENLLAREFNMPTEPEGVVRTLLDGVPFSCDVGDVNGRRFLAVCGVGFDAEVVARLTRKRSGHITYAAYFWPIWRTFWSHEFPVLTVDADGARVFEGPGLAFVGVIGRYSLGMRLLDDARFDDGLLDLCVLPCRSRAELFGHFLRVLQSAHRSPADVVYRQVREVRIDSPTAEVPVEVDGDAGGALPIRCTVAPGAARFLRWPR